MKQPEYLKYMEMVDWLREEAAHRAAEQDFEGQKKLNQAAQYLVTLRNRVMEYERSAA